MTDLILFEHYCNIIVRCPIVINIFNHYSRIIIIILVITSVHCPGFWLGDSCSGATGRTFLKSIGCEKARCLTHPGTLAPSPSTLLRTPAPRPKVFSKDKNQRSTPRRCCGMTEALLRKDTRKRKAESTNAARSTTWTISILFVTS